MRTILIITFFALLVCNGVTAQQQPAAFSLTDTVPAVFNGLQMGYSILSTKQKEVGDKGTFGRYSVRFYVTNTSGEAKILMYKQGFTFLSDLSPAVAQFNCLNATGARLTSKEAIINAPACNVLANVEDKDAAGKTKINKRFVQIGYWIKAGETIYTDAIVIVPLDEMPKMVVTPVFNTNQLVGDAYLPPVPGAGMPQFGQGNIQGFVTIKNLWKNTYLNNENGPAVCTDIQYGWWSSQWQILPVTGTNFYVIKNRWKENYISTENPATMLSVNGQARASLWVVEPVDQRTVRFRNAANNTYLNIEPGMLQSSQIQPDAWSSEWIIEPQQ